MGERVRAATADARGPLRSPHTQTDVLHPLVRAGAVAGAGLMLAGLILKGRPPGGVDLLLLSGLSLIGLALGGIVSLHGRGRGEGREDAPVARAAGTEPIEQLRDIEWQINESEARYRDLLDRQVDLIARLDSGGGLTFANRSLCRLLDIDPVRAIGRPFAPLALACGRDGPCAGMPAGVPGRGRVELVETLEGARWIAWSVTELAGGREGGGCQIVGRDVSEERRAAAALLAARDDAVAATEAKSRFLARMSHEIRTPMGGILGMAELLEETRLTAEQAVYLGAIEHSARALLKLVNEVLDLSKVEAGKLDIETAPVSPAACVQGVVELLTLQAAKSGIELAWSLGDQIPATITTDAHRCRQILLNLVGNAIKFTRTGGVRVALRRTDGGMLTVDVHDTGPGIAPAELERLFREFEQGGPAEPLKREGSGLGLAISRHLARALGGEVTAASTPGKGSCFSLLLPIGPEDRDPPLRERASGTVLLALPRPIEALAISETLAASGYDVTRQVEAGAAACAIILDARMGIEAARAALLAARGDRPRVGLRGIVIIDAADRGALDAFRAAGLDAYLVRPVRPKSLINYVSGAVEGAAPGRPASAPALGSAVERGRPPRVLLVEDNAINALLTERMLEHVGASPVLARSGSEALQIADTDQSFDLVLMDIHMPGIDGIETARRLRASFAERGLKAPPIVALTAGAFADDRRECLSRGLDDYVAKPFEKVEIEDLLARWCGRRDQVSREGALAGAAA